MKSLMKTKKVGRFADGGEVNYGEDERPAATGMSDAAKTADSPAAGPSSFKEAFASARKGGAKTFEYKGKKYTTDTAPARSSAGPSPAPAPAPSPQRVEITAKRAPKDDTTKSLAERAAATRTRARMGGTGTDDRSVGQRVRESLGFANGGLVKRGALKSHGKAC